MALLPNLVPQLISYLISQQQLRDTSLIDVAVQVHQRHADACQHVRSYDKIPNLVPSLRLFGLNS
jgi:hypothetical protein